MEETKGKVNAMMCRWREDGVSRKSFILFFAFAVLLLVVGFSRPSIGNIVEEVISGIIAIFLPMVVESYSYI